MRRADLPPHACGWSPHYRRTVPNHECDRCKLEDEMILDTQRFDQRVRSWLHRPARASTAVLPMSAFVDDEEDETEAGALELRRQTYLPLSDKEHP